MTSPAPQEKSSGARVYRKETDEKLLSKYWVEGAKKTSDGPMILKLRRKEKNKFCIAVAREDGPHVYVAKGPESKRYHKDSWQNFTTVYDSIKNQDSMAKTIHTAVNLSRDKKIAYNWPPDQAPDKA